MTYSLSVGKVIQGPVSNYISDVPANVQNTLTVTVKSYDVKSPVIRYVHVGPSTSRTSYTVKDIKPVNDNVYLDIDTNCKVYLYEVSEGLPVLSAEKMIVFYPKQKISFWKLIYNSLIKFYLRLK